MARAGSRPGLRLSTARALLLSAVFIMLSAYGAAAGRQCYWCGPLAEQVHRSRRAPPCEGAARHISVCDPGYDHCAIVATSPPYLESRFCVKFYQDECYPLFCNSTKTWKMTCPCRGDLCNGANTEREEDAFSALSRLLAKTHTRIKRRAPSIHLTGNRKGRIINTEPNHDHLLAGNSVEEPKGAQDNTQNDSLTEDHKEQVIAVTINTPLASQEISTSNQPVESEKEESQNCTNINEKEQPENGDDIQTTINQSIEQTTIDGKSESDSDFKIQSTTVWKQMENSKQSSTVMIEIDIMQRPSTFAQPDIKEQTIIPESNLLADEPVHHNDQSEDDNKNIQGDSEENKTKESTTSSLKLHSSESITTSRPLHIEKSINSDDKFEANINVSSESTSAETVLKTTTRAVGKPVYEKQNEMSSTERLSTVAYQVTGNTVASSVTQSSKKDKKNNNNAINVTINTLIIINCILLSTFI